MTRKTPAHIDRFDGTNCSGCGAEHGRHTVRWHAACGGHPRGRAAVPHRCRVELLSPRLPLCLLRSRKKQKQNNDKTHHCRTAQYATAAPTVVLQCLQGCHCLSVQVGSRPTDGRGSVPVGLTFVRGAEVHVGTENSAINRVDRFDHLESLRFRAHQYWNWRSSVTPMADVPDDFTSVATEL